MNINDFVLWNIDPKCYLYGKTTLAHFQTYMHGAVFSTHSKKVKGSNLPADWTVVWSLHFLPVLIFVSRSKYMQVRLIGGSQLWMWAWTVVCLYVSGLWLAGNLSRVCPATTKDIFSRAGGVALRMPTSVRRLVHHFGPEWKLSLTTWWNFIEFCTLMVSREWTNDSGDPLTFSSAPPWGWSSTLCSRSLKDTS